MNNMKKFSDFIKDNQLNEANVDWPKMHDDIIYDLEQILDRCYKFEDVINGKIRPAELNKAKKAHKKLEDAIKDIINSL